MLEYLEKADESLFLFLNGFHNSFLDVIMYWASDQLFWIPFYGWLAFFLFRKLGRTAWRYFFLIALMIVASDQLSSHLIKNWVRRPRPSHVTSLANRIHFSKAGPGGEYGFVSGHAANGFALAVFLLLSLPQEYRPLKILVLSWASLVSYSRIYNGVHYPGDVIGGALLGTLLAILFTYLLHRWWLARTL
jgi:undecaprenyl-diphosphatase